ncbi:MAG: hypothetical protein QM535_03720 [Limnohabitans sp.]|nr:hypothetical protein [Limnohabitans sp.]
MSWKITFNIIGDKFSPKNIPVKFFEQNEPNDIADFGLFKGKQYNYGSATYLVDKDIPHSEKFKHLADTFEPLLDDLKKYGAENWHILIERLYFSQCNEELDFNEIQEISRLKCSIAYSAYNVSEIEEKEGFIYFE